MAKTNDGDGDVSFVTYQPAFETIKGHNPQIFLLADSTTSRLALYHEACVYDSASRSVFVTSNQLANDPEDTYVSTSNKHVRLSRIYDMTLLQDGQVQSRVEEVSPSELRYSMLNGGVNFDTGSILFCAQGSKNSNDHAGLILLKIPDAENPDPVPEMFLDNFFGIPFNSVNDVIVHPIDHTIWFTDPCYGYHQGIRPKPRLPNQVYRYDPRTKSIRVVADGFMRPNGLCFSPDCKTLYITDTGAIHGSPDVEIDLAGPSHIYAFDVTYQSRPNEAGEAVSSQQAEPTLTNRRTFAYAPGRFPDGIKCDADGNVYSGCGDGIHVWNSQGVLIGNIKVAGGVANFCFGEKGALYACNETRFWKVQLNSGVVMGALLRI